MKSDMNNYQYAKYYLVKDEVSPDLISTLDQEFVLGSFNGEVKLDIVEKHDNSFVVSQYHESGIRIDYKLNKDGFRSKDFSEIKKDNLNILVSGCSWTYGDGLPEDYIWPSLLTEKFKKHFKDRKVSYYNLGTSGGSISLTCKNVLAFLRKYSDIDYVYLLLPGFDRSTMVEELEKNKKYRMKRVYYTSPEDPKFKNKAVRDFTLTYEPVNSIYHNLILIQAVIDICSLRNIKLFFGTWTEFDKEIYEYQNLKGYCDIPVWSEMEELTYSFDPTLKSIALDGVHPGSDHMNVIADSFYRSTFNG